nr:MAG: replication associated protein [Cressdnaviricota sp.]
MSKKVKDNRGRAFSVTLNNYVYDDACYIHSLPDNEPKVTYSIFGYEVGEQGTPHLQGYIYTKYKMTVKQVIDIFIEYDMHPHIEKCDGGIAAGIAYCMKDGDFYECGKRPHQGKRTDLDVVARLIEQGVSLATIAREYPSQYMFHFRSWPLYQQMCAPKKKTILTYYDHRFNGHMMTIMRHPEYETSKVIGTFECDAIKIVEAYASGQYTRLFVPDNNVMHEIFHDEEHEIL